MFLKTSLQIIYRAALKWIENGDSRLGAALAYYALFSIAPLLLIAVHISGAIFGEAAAQGNVHAQLNSIMGKETATAVEKMVESASENKGTTWAPLLSVVLLLFGALGAFLHVRTSLCMIWKLEPPQGSTWLALLWDYLLAIIMVFTTSLLLLVSVAFAIAIPILKETMLPYYEGSELYWQWLELGISFLFLTLLFATSYRILSGGRLPWIYVWYGSVVTSVLFTIGKTLLGYYLVYSGTASAYGAAGSVVVFLVWMYYSSQILFYGAELIQARRTRHEWMNS